MVEKTEDLSKACIKNLNLSLDVNSFKQSNEILKKTLEESKDTIKEKNIEIQEQKDRITNIERMLSSINKKLENQENINSEYASKIKNLQKANSKYAINM